MVGEGQGRGQQLDLLRRAVCRRRTPGRSPLASQSLTRPGSDSDASKRCASRRRKCQGPCSPGSAGRGRCPPWKWRPGCRCRLASRRTPEGGVPPPKAAASMSHNPELCWFEHLLLRSNCPMEGRVSHQPVHREPRAAPRTSCPRTTRQSGADCTARVTAPTPSGTGRQQSGAGTCVLGRSWPWGTPHYSLLQ